MSQPTAYVWMFCMMSCLLTVQCQLEAMLEATYNDDVSNARDTPQKNKCLDIHADIESCYSCFACDDVRITRRSKDNVDIAKLNMTDSSCASKEFCCIAQSSLTVRIKGKCGDFYPEGNPRSLRKSLRSVLPGEYPWRAWLYNSTHLLCAATYISDDDTRALLTSSSCVRDNRAGPLYVRFAKDGQRTEVTNKLINPEAGSDIMVMQVKELPPLPSIIPCCMPYSPPRFGTTCIAISDDDHYIYMAIPKQSVCERAQAAGGPGVFCAVAPSTDYRPARGSALICPDYNAKTMKYNIYGIALETSADGYTKYTNVHHYANWVDMQIDNLQTTAYQNNPYKLGYH